jgi:hypothetical protein
MTFCLSHKFKQTFIYVQFSVTLTFVPSDLAPAQKTVVRRVTQKI